MVLEAFTRTPNHARGSKRLVLYCLGFPLTSACRSLEIHTDTVIFG